MSWLKGKSKEVEMDSDFSGGLGKEHYKLELLTELGLKEDITAMTSNPVQSLFAIGTKSGQVVLFGQDSIQVQFHLPRPIKIKMLKFYNEFLCIIDSAETLFVYDYQILAKGIPTKYASLTLRGEVTCIESSALLPHLLIGLADGTIEVFDISRASLARSSRISNLWLAQDELNRRSGIEIDRKHIPIVTDIKFHPLELNLILIAYEGGVVLFDLMDRKSVRSWDFVLPPGASGGGNDLGDELFTERRLGVSCVSWRPDGLLFVVGHTDGCFSFVSPADENLITIGTLERFDVHKISEEDIFGWNSNDGENGSRKSMERESIYKLSWSGFSTTTEVNWGSWNTSTAIPSVQDQVEAQSGTILTILGGLSKQDSTGIHCFHLPGFQLPPTTNTTSHSIPTTLRQALFDSIIPSHQSFISTTATVEDYLLIPRDSPHFEGSFDPTGIIILTGRDPKFSVVVGQHGERSINAYSFPPAIQGREQTKKKSLPSILSWTGDGTVPCKMQIVNLSKTSYQKLTRQLNSEEAEKGLFNGGNVTTAVNEEEQQSPKKESYRIIISLHVDLTMRFHDISSLFGINSTASSRPLPHLTINLAALLQSAQGRQLRAGHLYRARPWDLELKSFSFAKETLECSVTCSTGDVIVSRFTPGQGYANSDDDTLSSVLAGLELEGEEGNYADSSNPVPLGNSSQSHLHSFMPTLALYIPPLSVDTILELCDLGLIAIANAQGLLIVNSRSSKVLLYESNGGEASKVDKKGKKIKKEVNLEDDSIIGFKWTICEISKEPDPALRLLVIYQSGLVKIHEFYYEREWKLNSRISTFQHDSLKGLITSFVLDREGNVLGADEYGLTKLRSPSSHHHSSSIPCYWVTVAPSVISIFLGVDGKKLNSFEINSSSFCSAYLLLKSGYIGLVTVATNQEITIISLPGLFIIEKLLFESKIHTNVGLVSLAQDGTLLQLSSPLSIKIFSLFPTLSPFPPSITLYNPTILTPPVVNSLTSITTGISSYWSGKKVITIAEMDVILGGNNRLPLKKRTDNSIGGGTGVVARNTADIIATYKLPTSSYTANRAAEQAQLNQTEVVQSETSYLASIMSATSEALAQRGEHLENLSNGIAEAAESAKKYAIDASNTAKKEATKRTVMGGFGSFFKGLP